MKNKVHLAQLGLISEGVCEPWRAFKADVKHKCTKPHASTHHQRDDSYTLKHTHLMSAQTHLESVHVIFHPINPAGQGNELHFPARLAGTHIVCVCLCVCV